MRFVCSRFTPWYFEKDISSGVPVLTAEGRRAIAEEMAEASSYCLEAHPGDVPPNLEPESES